MRTLLNRFAIASALALSVAAAYADDDAIEPDTAPQQRVILAQCMGTKVYDDGAVLLETPAQSRFGACEGGIVGKRRDLETPRIVEPAAIDLAQLRRLLSETHVMNNPLAQPLFGMFDVPPGDAQRPGGRAIDGQFDRLGGLVCRLDPIARELAGKLWPLRLVGEPASHLVAGSDVWIGDDPLSHELGRGAQGLLPPR